MSEIDKPSKAEDEYFAKQELERRKKWAAERAAQMAVEEKENLKKAHWMKCPKCGMDLAEIAVTGSDLRFSYRRLDHCQKHLKMEKRGTRLTFTAKNEGLTPPPNPRAWSYSISRKLHWLSGSHSHSLLSRPKCSYSYVLRASVAPPPLAYWNSCTCAVPCEVDAAFR